MRRTSLPRKAAGNKPKRPWYHLTTTRKIILYVAACVLAVSLLHGYGETPEKETCAASKTVAQLWDFGFWLLGASAVSSALIWGGLYLYTQWHKDSLETAIRELQQAHKNDKPAPRSSVILASVASAGPAAAADTDIPNFQTWTRAEIMSIQKHDIYSIPDTEVRQIVRWLLRAFVLTYILCTCVYGGAMLYSWMTFSKCAHSTTQFAAATLMLLALCFVTFALNIVEKTNTQITVNPVKNLHLLTSDFASGKETATALKLHIQCFNELDTQQREYETAYNAIEKRQKNNDDMKQNDKSAPHKSTYKQLLLQSGWTETDIDILEERGWLVQVFKRKVGLTFFIGAVLLAYACVITIALDDRQLETFKCDYKYTQLHTYGRSVTDITPIKPDPNAEADAPRALTIISDYYELSEPTRRRRQLLGYVPGNATAAQATNATLFRESNANELQIGRRLLELQPKPMRQQAHQAQKN